MADPTSQTYKLPSGRTIGYAEFGALTGSPIFSFHGWPGSRLCGAHSDEVAKELNARIISVDRPGASNRQAGRLMHALIVSNTKASD